MTKRNPMGFHRPHGRVQTDCAGESRTKQSFKNECDINRILRQFYRTGLVSHVSKRQGYYGDFIGAGTYHDALNLIHEARDMFLELPAKIRAEFDNDPAKFLDFVHDPENEEQMREMGLLNAKAEKPVQEQIKETEENLSTILSDALEANQPASEQK